MFFLITYLVVLLEGIVPAAGKEQEQQLEQDRSFQEHRHSPVLQEPVENVLPTNCNKKLNFKIL